MARRIFSLVTILAMLATFVVLPVTASAATSGTCGDDLTWVLDDDGTLTISGSGDMKDYSSGWTPWYSNRADIIEAVISDGVTSIGASTFCNCDSLLSVSISDNVTSIGNYAFSGCSSITNITIPDNVTSIGNYAFSGCSSITDITIPDNVTSIGSYTFSGCSGITNITIPTGVTSIGGCAFNGCSGLKNITVPAGVTEIGYKAFYGCSSLSDISMPDSAICIGYQVFYDTAYANDESNWDGDLLFIGKNLVQTSDDLTGSCAIKEGTVNIGGAFYGCTGLTEVTIPNSVVTIGISAFYGCTSLTEITIPDSVVTIGTSAFHGCTGLTDITIGKGITSIAAGAFSSCTALTNVYISDLAAWVNIDFVIPEGKSDTPSTPMCYADNLYINNVLATDIVIPNGVAEIKDYAFYCCTGLTSVTIPDSVTDIGRAAFYGCSGLTGIIIPASVTSIGISAFQSCSGLTAVTIPNNFTNISDRTFFGCTNLVDIVIPDSVTSIGDDVFYNCSSLTSITMSAGITSIDSDAFYNCTALSNVYISDLAAWVSIDFSNATSNPLYYADNLYINGVLATDITIPAYVTEIKDRAFYCCTCLTSVDIPDGIVTIGEAAFCGCTELSSLTISDSVTSIRGSAFSSCTGLTDLTIPGSVTLIYKMAFQNCTGLKNITILDGVAGIGNEYGQAFVFDGCTSLETIVIPSSVTSIGAKVFNDCSALTDVYYTGSEDEWNDIYMMSGNDCLTAATIHYNYVIPTTFTMLRDNYSFANTWSSFGYGYDYKIPLERYITVFGSTYGVQQYINSDNWGGSCYGFSSSSLLFFEDNLDYKDYSSTASCLFDISAPKSPTADLTVLIEEYQISQLINSVAWERYKNTDDMEEIISAVEHFEETGEDPIILCVWSEYAGHAVVPYKVDTNSDGSYSVYVYDNNYPYSTTRIVTINPATSSFSYEDYTLDITYNYAETVYNAFNADSASLASSEDVAVVTINSDDFSFTDLNGISIESIDGAYELIPVSEKYDSTKKQYVVPVGDYIIENHKTDIDELEVSIANELDYQNLKTDDLDATIVLGVNGSTGRVYTYINSSADSNSSIQVLNSSGVTKYIEATGSVLGVITESTGSISIVSDTSVSCNGSVMSVNSSGLTSSVNMSSSSGGIIVVPDQDYTVTVGSNTLTHDNSEIDGSLSLNIYNNTESISGARIMMCLYSSDGQLVSLLKNNNVVLGLGSNYIDMGDVSCSGLSGSGYYIKCFIWDGSGSMNPLTNAYSVSID